MYERFTARARKVMILACEEAQRLKHEYVGTEHILLGLVKEGSGVALNVLKNLDIDLRKIPLETEKLLQSGPVVVITGKLPQTPRAKKVIEYAIEESKELDHNFVGTEHLLLGLLREWEGVGSLVLRNLGLNLEDVRDQVLLCLGQLQPAEGWVRRSQQGAEIESCQSAEPKPRLWTHEEYYRMAEMGFFQGQRVELIEGEIMVLSPQKAEHWTTTDCITELLRNAFGSGFHVRMQGPIDFGAPSEPEPDVAVVAGARALYATHHPTTAVLIVEVSESTLYYDRNRKASLYARAGIADYWIVNPVNRQLEVRRDPRPDSSQPYGHGYASVTTLVPPAVINPLAAPQVSLAVAELLP